MDVNDPFPFPDESFDIVHVRLVLMHVGHLRFLGGEFVYHPSCAHFKGARQRGRPQAHDAARVFGRMAAR